MGDLRSLLMDAEPYDDRGFPTAAEIRGTAVRRSRRNAVVAVLAAVAVVALVPLGVIRQAAAPPPANPGPTASSYGIGRTVWFVDYRASGITDDPTILPRDGAFSLWTVLQLDPEGRLSIGNGYRAFQPWPGGRWEGGPTSGSVPIGASGPLSLQHPGVKDAVGVPDCTEGTCPEGSLQYWPGFIAVDRFEQTASYVVERATSSPFFFPTGRSMRLLDAEGRTLLVLIEADYDRAVELFSQLDATPSCSDAQGGPAYCPSP